MSTPSSSSGMGEKAVTSEKNTTSDSTVVALNCDGEQQTIHEVPDPNDHRNPQNWSPWKKRLLFLALMSSSILADGYVQPIPRYCIFC